MIKPKIIILNSVYSLHRLYGDDVIYCDVSCVIFVMPCDAEMYCDDLK